MFCVPATLVCAPYKTLLTPQDSTRYQTNYCGALQHPSAGSGPVQLRSFAIENVVARPVALL